MFYIHNDNYIINFKIFYKYLNADLLAHDEILGPSYLLYETYIISNLYYYIKPINMCIYVLISTKFIIRSLL